MEESRRLIRESCQRINEIYQNSPEGKRANLPEEFWSFYCQWVIAQKLGDHTLALNLRTQLRADCKIHIYSAWMDDVRDVVSKHLRGNESKKNK